MVHCSSAQRPSNPRTKESTPLALLHFSSTKKSSKMARSGSTTPAQTVREGTPTSGARRSVLCSLCPAPVFAGLNDLDDKRIKSIRPLIPPQILMEDCELLFPACGGER